MAKLSDLIETYAAISKLPKTIIWQIGRALREDGKIKTGSKGRYGGADMTAEDAAALVLTTAGTRLFAPHIATAVETHGKYSVLPGTVEPACEDFSGSLGLRSKHTFGDAVAAFIHAASNGTLQNIIAGIQQQQQPGFEVGGWSIHFSVFGPWPQARIMLHAGGKRFEHHYREHIQTKKLREWAAEHEKNYPGDFRETRTFTEHTILALGQCLRGEAD